MLVTPAVSDVCIAMNDLLLPAVGMFGLLGWLLHLIVYHYGFFFDAEINDFKIVWRWLESQSESC